MMKNFKIKKMIFLLQVFCISLGLILPAVSLGGQGNKGKKSHKMRKLKRNKKMVKSFSNPQMMNSGKQKNAMKRERNQLNKDRSLKKRLISKSNDKSTDKSKTEQKYKQRKNDGNSDKPSLDGKRDNKFAERIKDGIKSKEISEVEGKVLKDEKKKLSSYIDQAKKDGELSVEEKVKIRKMEDKYSSLIFKFKHNDESLAGNDSNKRSPASDDGTVNIQTIKD